MPHEDPPTPAGTARRPVPPFGVVYDVDGVLRIARLRRQLGRILGQLRRSPRDRRSVLGMPHLVRTLAGSEPGSPVFYLTAVPARFERQLTGLLDHDGNPAGQVLSSGCGLWPGWLLAGPEGKCASLDRLVELHPRLRWVLVGDDAGDDPQLFTDFVRRHPGRVAAIALRQVVKSPNGADSRPAQVSGVGVVAAPNGEEMLPRLRARLELDEPRAAAIDDWFLTGSERGNDAARLRAWTTGNAVRALVHGKTYFSVLADALDATARGDAVLFAGWPRRIDQKVVTPAAELAQAEAMAMVREAGGDRVQIFDIENRVSRPIYVHAKVCVVDDVWAVIGSNNHNNRSWTHDSELTAAILDEDRDPRTPADPAGLGDGARRFARELRLHLMGEHVDHAGDADLIDPDRAAETLRRRAAALDEWHTNGCRGPRPPGRLRAPRIRRRAAPAALASPPVHRARIPDRARSRRAPVGDAAAPRLLTGQFGIATAERWGGRHGDQ